MGLAFKSLGLTELSDTFAARLPHATIHAANSTANLFVTLLFILLLLHSQSAVRILFVLCLRNGTPEKTWLCFAKVNAPHP
jgi:hypothetical protein